MDEKNLTEALQSIGTPSQVAILSALVAGFASLPVQADFVSTQSSTSISDEDTPISLGVSAAQAFFIGGSQLDVIGTATAFVDAADTSKLVDVTIPAGTQFVRVTGLGGNDNGANDTREEEYAVLVVTEILDR